MKKLFVDLDLCIGCQAHSVACHQRNLRVPTFRTGNLSQEETLPVVCRHCEEPACVAACPWEAMRVEEDGTVRRSPGLCTGCKSCVLACPFGVLARNLELGRFAMAKCDLCAERVAKGLEPACVSACPTGAIRWEEPGEAMEDRNFVVLGGHHIGHNPYIRR